MCIPLVLLHCCIQILTVSSRLSTLHQKTQNIDGLEAVAGVNPEKLVECHGHFRSASCINCGIAHEVDDCKESMLKEGAAPKCNSCGSLVKPVSVMCNCYMMASITLSSNICLSIYLSIYSCKDIVFFGEVCVCILNTKPSTTGEYPLIVVYSSLGAGHKIMPSRFSDLVHFDVAACDLVVVLGTSLLVAPVSSIPDWVKSDVPRLLINRELVGSFMGPHFKKDVFLDGDCDER